MKRKNTTGSFHPILGSVRNHLYIENQKKSGVVAYISASLKTSIWKTNLVIGLPWTSTDYLASIFIHGF